MTSDALTAALEARNVKFTELANGDIFFRRQHDGQSMYIRRHNDGTYDWSQNAARNDTNLMDFSRPEHHDLAEVLRRVDDFLGLIVSGRVVIDTLGIVRKSMAQGMGRANAERIAAIARNFALEMHQSGMDADEIRTRFEEIHDQLKRERLDQSPVEVGSRGQ
jgi:hypothetical protein